MKWCDTEKMLYTFREIKRALGQSTAGPDFDVTGLNIDSRFIAPGHVFVALKGTQTDGHKFVADAFEKGAVCAIVEQVQDVDIPQIVVPDSLEALGCLARAQRDWSTQAKRIAITGSCGKTSVKELLAHVLSCHKSLESHNNHIGVPLTLSRLPRASAYGVFEIGMNHPGEIAPLAQMVKPHVAVITTVAPAHIGAFESLDGIAAEKMSICDALMPGGTVVTSAETYQQYPHYFPQKPLTFSLDDRVSADIRCVARSISYSGQTLVLSVAKKQFTVTLPRAEEVCAINTVCVLTICLALGLDIEKVAARLHDMPQIKGRWYAESVKGIRVIDDSYNANPVSMSGALRALKAYPAAKKRIAILGDMLELGASSRQCHIDLAPLCDEMDWVICVGQEMKALYDSLHQRVKKDFYATVGEIDAADIITQLEAGDAVMVKGSKGIFWKNEFVEKLKLALMTDRVA